MLSDEDVATLMPLTTTPAWCDCTDSYCALRQRVATAINEIVARHVTAALNEAADRLDEEHDTCPNARGCEYCVVYVLAARIVRDRIPT